MFRPDKPLIAEPKQEREVSKRITQDKMEVLKSGIKEAIRARVNPAEYLRETISYLDELGLVEKELRWIIGVKRESEKQEREELEEIKKMGDEEYRALVKPPKILTAYDVVLVHLMLLRDLKRLGPNRISKSTEDKLDEITNYIFWENDENRLMKLNEWRAKHPLVLKDTITSVDPRNREPEQLSIYQRRFVEKVKRLFTSRDQSAQTKVRNLTEYLMWRHAGGSYWVEFNGVPISSKYRNIYMGNSLAMTQFFRNLNNLGNHDYWNSDEYEARIKEEIEQAKRKSKIIVRRE